MSTSTVCTGGGGQYQVSWTQSGGKILVTSIGYYPDEDQPEVHARGPGHVRAGPVVPLRDLRARRRSTSRTTPTIMGDIYSDGIGHRGSGATICGSVLSSAGGVTLQNGGQSPDRRRDLRLLGKVGEGLDRRPTGIVGAQQVVIAGDAIAGAPSTTTCSSTSSSYAITISGGGPIRCRRRGGVRRDLGDHGRRRRARPGVTTTAPVPVTFPPFVFDPNNYPTASTDPLHLQCYPSGGTCGSNQSTTAIADFNAYIATHKTSLTGTFAVWQSNPQPMVEPGDAPRRPRRRSAWTASRSSGDFTLDHERPGRLREHRARSPPRRRRWPQT